MSAKEDSSALNESLNPNCEPHEITLSNGSNGNNVMVQNDLAPLSTAAVAPSDFPRVVGPGQSAVVNNHPNAIVPLAAAESEQTQDHWTQETISSVRKCLRFLLTLIELADARESGQELRKQVVTTVHELVIGQISIQNFIDGITAVLKAIPQPRLFHFLERTLPDVRKAILEIALGPSKSDAPSIIQDGQENVAKLQRLQKEFGELNDKCIIILLTNAQLSLQVLEKDAQLRKMANEKNELITHLKKLKKLITHVNSHINGDDVLEQGPMPAQNEDEDPMETKDEVTS